MTRDRGERPWRLCAWTSGTLAERVLIFDGTCLGDDALDREMRGLERRTDFGHLVVATEVKMGRLTYAAPVTARLEPGRAVACAICEMPEPECRRRANVSGHQFTPPSRQSTT